MQEMTIPKTADLPVRSVRQEETLAPASRLPRRISLIVVTCVPDRLDVLTDVLTEYLTHYHDPAR